MLAKSKYNSIEALISQALTDIDISHDFKGKDKYEKMKQNIKEKNECKKQEIVKSAV